MMSGRFKQIRLMDRLWLHLPPTISGAASTTLRHHVQSSVATYCSTNVVSKPKWINYFVPWQTYTSDEIQARLDHINNRLAEAKKEDFHLARGNSEIRKLLVQDALKIGKKRNPKAKFVRMELFRLLFARHALENGGHRLSEFKPHQLAKTFLGPETELMMDRERAKQILVELWRFGRSKTLHVYKQMEARRFKRLTRASLLAKATEKKDRRQKRKEKLLELEKEHQSLLEMEEKKKMKKEQERLATNSTSMQSG
jgi:hypothetical protein